MSLLFRCWPKSLRASKKITQKPGCVNKHSVDMPLACPGVSSAVQNLLWNFCEKAPPPTFFPNSSAAEVFLENSTDWDKLQPANCLSRPKFISLETPFNASNYKISCVHLPTSNILQIAFVLRIAAAVKAMLATVQKARNWFRR